ncbi:MlaE family ABC transporter permease [Geoalkalibacter halelectricus]|uniref:ABC transporter permease n=1 Tax=Geoalkalibacter halelectricus TaxID=2847045 RepID=A0ABY5ZJ72_9BACT|nr:ABC transporter permease [Geoalkalibacter halelectricus]MDO3378242.1 ABC transporter permease [Geoalkalibacter halelectricus]UWZ79167.1 ABC transporter permease [Geoalkalibacter halelectricus]
MPDSTHPRLDPAQISWHTEADGALRIRFAGPWDGNRPLPDLGALLSVLDAGPREVVLCADALGPWDSRFLAFVLRLLEACRQRRIPCRREGLPEGAQRLLVLAEAVPEQGAGSHVEPPSLLHRFGLGALEWRRKSVENLAFFGEASFSFLRLFSGRARFRRADLLLYLHEAGAQALPIVTLISLLVGLILAFVGAVQLRMFGAEIYIADAVGLGMAREMGAMMTGIIMAGRTGAAYAAQLGTMQVNEEIDALRTFGVAPMDFLVLPRMLALMLMLPLLTIYAILMGILGGAVVGIGLFDIPATQYYQQTINGVPLIHFIAGLIKACAYGLIVATAGCLRGMHSGRSAAAVGEATTSAVVTAIVWIILANALLTVIYHVLGI